MESSLSMIITLISRFITFLLYIFSIAKTLFCYLMFEIFGGTDSKSEFTNFMDVMKPSEVSQKYWYLESVLKLEDEINRNIGLLGSIFAQSDENDEIRVVIGIELSKAAMLKKGKLKMFRNLCLVALKEIPPIEGDKEVTVDDLDGFWNLLGIEAEKHRQTVIEITTPKAISDDKSNIELPCDTVDLAGPIKPIIKTSSTNKKSTAVTKAALKVSKSNIDERNRKYMERMKKLRELKAKPMVKVQDKENQTPNRHMVTREVKLTKQCDNLRTSSPKIQSVQW